jgi:hypothetical protein
MFRDINDLLPLRIAVLNPVNPVLGLRSHHLTSSAVYCLFPQSLIFKMKLAILATAVAGAAAFAPTSQITVSIVSPTRSRSN